MNQPQSQPLLNGEQIGVYEIKSLKHVGPTAIWYHVKNEHMNAMEVLVEYFPGNIARRAQDGRGVVCLSESQRQMFERGLQRFMDQAERLSDVEHAAIARVYNTLQFNGTGYFVLDNSQGTPLDKLLESATSMGQTELEYLLTTLLDGIREAHAKGVIHGDIHPSNILIRSSGEPLLVNFVVNRLAMALDEGILEKSLRSGYAAPELNKNTNTPKPAADIYALGATFYRCMTHADPSSSAERLAATAKGELDPLKTALEKVKDGYGVTFFQAVLSMLETSEDPRLQSADAVLSALGNSSHESIGTKSSQALPDAAPSSAPGSRSSHAMWLGAGALILLLIVGLWSSGTNDQPPTEVATTAQQEPAKVVPEPKPAESAITDLPKYEAAAPRANNEQPVPPLLPPPAPSEPSSNAVTASVPAANALAEQPSGAAEQPAEALTPPQTQAPTTDQMQMAGNSTPPPVAEADEKQASIQIHLAAAEAAYNAFRLSTPADDNAYSHYQAVLALDSENTAAKEGIKKLVGRYARLIDRAIKAGSYMYARVYLDRAKAIKPDDAALKRLEEELQAAHL